MNKLKLVIISLMVLTATGFISCGKDDDKNESYSVVGTTWVYTNDDGDGKNIFEFTDEEKASFTQEWVDSGEDKSETKEGTYTYSHPSISITVGSKVYSGSIDGQIMTLSGYAYNKQ